LNPYKVKVIELPEPIEQEWVTVLKRVDLKSHNAFDEQSRLYGLFDEAYRLAKRYPQDSVLAYAIGRFVTARFAERDRVRDKNWPLLHRLLLQCALAEQGTLPRVATLLYRYRSRGLELDQSRVSTALNSIVIDQASRGHGSEVAWSLYAAICLGVTLDTAAGLAVSGMLDDIVALVALHARDLGLLPDLDTARWQEMIASDALEGEHWLLAYEAPLHGWLTGGPDDPIGSSARFASLRAGGVSFYDTSALPPAPPASAGPVRERPAAQAPST
jgi:hypothetical protein